MILTKARHKRLQKYRAGKLDELTEKEIGWCRWILAIHAEPNIIIVETSEGNENNVGV